MPAPSKPVYPTANPRLLSSVSLFGSWPGNWGKPPMWSCWKLPRTKRRWAPFSSAFQSTFEMTVFQTSGVDAVNL